MSRINQFTFALFLICCSALFISIQAQTPRVSTVNITAEADKVRINAQGEISEMRINVRDEQGTVVFESGAITGQQLDWDMKDAQGERVAPGTYLVTVTFHNAAGKLSKRVTQVTVAEDAKASTQAAVEPAPNAPQATITGSGTAGKIAKFTGAATIGNSVITESAGKIGIGTAAPTTTLTVASTAANTAAILASDNAAGGIGVKGTSSNATGTGVWGLHTATTGATPGVKGETNSTAANAAGVLGVVTSNNPGFQAAGVRGEAAGSGAGVVGSAPGGQGVSGFSTTGFGVYGVSSRNTGVLGTSTSGRGVRGVSISSYGMWGSSDSSNGVYGDSQSGYGVLGTSFSKTGVFGSSINSYGVWGLSENDIGVYGQARRSGNGVRGISNSGRGVFGYSISGEGVYGQSGGNDGILGESSSSGHSGVAGVNRSSGNGVYGESASGYAGYFAGHVRVDGTLTKASGSFKIDHPLDPANKTLSHSFVESPDMMNIYNGNVTLDRKGQAVVVMPAYFNALNRDFRYQLTAIGQPGPKLYIAEKIAINRFKIAGGKPGMEVSWMVTGIRQDAYAEAHRIPVEEDKPAKERGTYLNPEVFGQPKEKGVERARQAEQTRQQTAEAARAQTPLQK